MAGCLRLYSHKCQTLEAEELLLSTTNVILSSSDITGLFWLLLKNNTIHIFTIVHLRYVFEKTGKNAFLQELGPQFCLKLQWLQKGTFNPTEGEFEWLRKVELETSRRRFFL